MKIEIDISGWREEHDREEMDLSTKELAFQAQLEHGYTSAQISRMLVVARMLGQTEADVLPSNEELFHVGTKQSWLQAISHQMIKVTMPNGKIRGMRRFTLGTSGESDVLAESSAALSLARAHTYLQRQVPAHVMSRLEILAAHSREQLEVGVTDLYSAIAELHLELVNGKDK